MNASCFAPGGAISRGDVLRVGSSYFIAWARRRDGQIAGLPVKVHNTPRHRSAVAVHNATFAAAMGIRHQAYLIHTLDSTPVSANDIVGRCPPALMRQIETTKRHAEEAARAENVGAFKPMMEVSRDAR